MLRLIYIYKHTFVHINHHSQSPWPSSWR